MREQQSIVLENAPIAVLLYRISSVISFVRNSCKPLDEHTTECFVGETFARMNQWTCGEILLTDALAFLLRKWLVARVKLFSNFSKVACSFYSWHFVSCAASRSGLAWRALSWATVHVENTPKHLVLLPMRWAEGDHRFSLIKKKQLFFSLTTAHRLAPTRFPPTSRRRKEPPCPRSTLTVVRRHSCPVRAYRARRRSFTTPAKTTKKTNSRIPGTLMCIALWLVVYLGVPRLRKYRHSAPWLRVASQQVEVVVKTPSPSSCFLPARHVPAQTRTWWA